MVVNLMWFWNHYFVYFLSILTVISQEPTADALTKQAQTLLRVYEREEIRKVFDLYAAVDKESSASEHAGSMPKDKLEEALKALDISAEDTKDAMKELDVDLSGGTDKLSLEAFVRIARRPSEVEQWIQMMPLAAILARSLRRTAMDELEQLQEHEIRDGLALFFQAVTQLFHKRLGELRSHRKEEESIKAGNAKYGTSGYKMVGGSVEDFHKGLEERMGALFLSFAG